MRLIFFLAVMVATARAQDTAMARACDQPAAGLVDAAIYGQVSPFRRDTARVDTAYLHDVLEAIRESLHPGALTLNAYVTEPFGVMLAGEATVLFTVTRDGTVRDLGLASSSLSPEFDRAVYHAVQVADSMKLIPPLPSGAGSRVKFHLTMYTSPYPEEPRYQWLERRGVVKPLVTTKLPRWDGPITPPEPLSHDTPRYPEIARESNVEDTLQIRFVLDTTGRVIPASIWFLSGTYLDFARSIRNWIPQARYRPMRIGTCAVPSIEWQVFQYRLTKRP